MTEETESQAYPAGRAAGATTIAPGVLVTIVRLTALAVPGVASVAPVPGGVNRLFRRGAGEGIRIEIEGNSVTVDLYLELALGVNIRDVSRKVQANVARAVKDMVGMEVKQINIFIEDIRPGEQVP